MESTRGGQLEVASEIKGTGLYLAKKRKYSNNIISSLVDMRTTLFPSYSMTHAEVGMESIGSEQVSLSHRPFQVSNCTKRIEVIPSVAP